MKSKALEYVKEHVSKPCKGAKLDEHETLSHILHMIASNLFRTLPDQSRLLRDSFTVFSSGSTSTSSSSSNGSKTNARTRSGSDKQNEKDMKNAPVMSFDGGPEFSDPSWSHLQVCYAILRDIILTSNTPLAVKKKVIRIWFVKKLIDVFRSKDKRERTQVKLSVHRIYGSLTNRRSCIRQAVNESFYMYLYERIPHCGIFEMLEFLLSIVNGFGTPLRKEHLTTLNRALIPLHKMEDEPTYHDRLQYCMVLYITKDNNLASTIISEVLRFWPKAGSRMKVLGFLAEIDEILAMGLSDKIIDKIRKCLTSKLLCCVRSDHSEIALRTLHMLHHNKYVRELFQDKDETLRLEIRTRVKENAKAHWSEQVRTYSSAVLSSL